ncbi:MAG TPA: diguanylate cyclase [Nitrospirota bacterium]|nr:diguanylate cyclase [Nitrospirota bacterium]
MNAITGDDLKDLFTTETWRDHFTTLSESLGFSLSIYSQTGRPIFIQPGALPPCRAFRESSQEFKMQCESFCDPLMMKSLSTGKPQIFKCYAKIMSFALPIEYMDEKAIILGRGSFSSYEDFRECMNLISSSGLDTISITTPLTFTTFDHAQKVCGFVADSVNRLLRNSQETITLRKKFENLKNILGTWGSASEEQPETLYGDMINKLSTLLDIEGVAILPFNEKHGKYASQHMLTRSRRPSEAITINAHDSVVQELINGKSFVLSAEPIRDPAADFLNGMGALYFFPILVSNKLEAIVRISDIVLKDTDKQIILSFCQQTALSIENNRLHQDLYKKFNRFAALAELTKAIAPIQNHETLLRTILDKSAELLKAEQGSLMLLDNATNTLLLEVKKGLVEGLALKQRINRGEGIAGKVVELGEAFLVENVESDPRTRQKNRQHYKTRSFISVPLKIDDRVIGVLNLSDKTTGEVFDEEDLRLIQSFATHAAIVMERNALYSKAEELKKLTITDSLTGLLNRRYLYERLKDELSRSERHKHNLSLLMLDLDGFKYCNDTYGHVFGDKTLKAVADALLSTLRSMDVVARFGGDEFMVILPETSEPLAIDIAERLRNNIATEVVFPDGPTLLKPKTLTASIGVVCYPQHGENLELLIENVDKALYRAKNKGKNAIEVFS